MHQNANNMSQNFLGKLSTLYIASVQVKSLVFIYKNDNFCNYFKKHLIKIYTNTHQIAPLLKIFSENLLNPVMYAHLLLFEKNTIQKCPLFPIFKRSSLIHKNKPALVASIVLKKSTATVFVRFLKNTFNFTRSCAFAQKAKFYALKMLKKQNLTHPKATKLAPLQGGLAPPPLKIG